MDELLTLAHALNASPVHLLVPPDDDDAPYPVTPKVRIPRKLARWFVRGLESLPGQNWRLFGVEGPADEVVIRDGKSDEWTIGRRSDGERNRHAGR
ncbi:hypothetical protein [Nocardiopsis sp. CNR-923]|uniref:hypothetical protein n=1 Tax=Nocardiopsis sp. CNR-923 TaxID=1904965 RepID=UPI00117D5D71|nr:hypothetical protein [Nocardiopsis sp. CNR-923]